MSIEPAVAPEATLRAGWSVRQALQELARRPLAMIGLAIFLVLVFAAIAAPLIAPYSPFQQDLSSVLAGPSGHHLLGTDSLGRDVLSRLIYGARPALIGAAEATLVVLLVAVPAGLAAGYFSGWADTTISRIADIALSIPAIMFLLVVLAVFSGDQNAVLIAFGLLVAPGVMRVVRSVTLSVRRELFVDAAKVSGVSERRILSRHILPLLSGPIIVQVTLVAAAAILVEAALGFLGLGPQPPQASWGEMVSEASMQLSRQSWLVFPSGAVLIVAVISLGLMGDAVRDVSAERFGPVGRPRVRRTPPRTTESQLAAPTGEALPAADALLSVRNLSVAFATPDGFQTVVEDVSFDLYSGETLGLLGESGCGKTVTSLALIGLLPLGGQVTSGSCWFEGSDLLRMPERQLAAVRGRKIGMVSQEPMAALDPVFTVGSHLREAVRIHENLSRREVAMRVSELLEMVELHDTARITRLYPFELSGGMAQRVVIALALAGRPRLLIADEPTTALDVTVQAEILELMRSLQQESALAILLVTHNWGVVADSCQRAVVMYAGQVVESGQVEPIFEQPLHPYTSGLLLSNPEQATPRQTLPSIPGSVPTPSEWPQGCRFAPRCAFVTPGCRRAPIDLVAARSDRLSRCIHIDELVRRTERA